MSNDIYSVTGRIVTGLGSNLSSSHTKAYLAQLRSSINQKNDFAGPVWQLLFTKMPKDFINLEPNGKLTKEERVILSTLQLYALHQQGNSESVNLTKNEYPNDAGHFDIHFDGRYYYLNSKNSSTDDYTMQRKFKHSTDLTSYLTQWQASVEYNPFYEKGFAVTLGASLGMYRNQLDNSVSFDKRFNQMIMAKTYDELIINLRNLIYIIKSKGKVKINYPQLAKDLYNLLGSQSDRQRVILRWSQNYYFNTTDFNKTKEND